MNKSSVSHFHTANSLFNGNYNGEFTINEVLKFGNFGLGTINGLNGEMIILDGIAYIADGTGKISVIENEEKTPFAVITKFNSMSEFNMSHISFSSIATELESKALAKDYFQAIKIEGIFEHIEYRSNFGLSETAPNLQAVIKNANTFTKNSISGTLVGFYVPPIAEKINVLGYHFHFIDEQCQLGGHVNDFTIGEAKVQIEIKKSFNVYI